MHPHREQIAAHIAEVMRLLGLDAEADPELLGTPDRVADLWIDELTGAEAPVPEIQPLPSSGDQEDMVLVRDLRFVSTCAHHLTPFFGTCSVAYIPGESLIGVGTPARVLQHFAKRPQIQERLGEQVATFITKAINPRGVIVHLMGRHLCMELRGAQARGLVETTATRGWFSDQEWRSEFFERMMRQPMV